MSVLLLIIGLITVRWEFGRDRHRAWSLLVDRSVTIIFLRHYQGFCSLTEVWDLFLGASVGCVELFEYGNFIVIIRVFSFRFKSAEVSALVTRGR